jgi:ferredoxin
VKVIVDRERCEGHGMCANVAPEVYDLDDEAVVVVLHEDLPEAAEGQAQAGALACPVAALRVAP